MDSKLDYLRLTRKEDFTPEVIREMVEFFDRDEDHITPVWVLWRAGFTFDDMKTMAETNPALGLDLGAIYDLENAIDGE